MESLSGPDFVHAVLCKTLGELVERFGINEDNVTAIIGESVDLMVRAVELEDQDAADSVMAAIQRFHKMIPNHRERTH